MKVREIQLPGRRVVRVGSYTLDGDGELPELRVFVGTAWQGVGLLPFSETMVDLPASALPQLIEALASLEGTA
jgi:hypothetical protein